MVLRRAMPKQWKTEQCRSCPSALRPGRCNRQCLLQSVCGADHLRISASCCLLAPRIEVFAWMLSAPSKRRESSWRFEWQRRLCLCLPQAHSDLSAANRGQWCRRLWIKLSRGACSPEKCLMCYSIDPAVQATIELRVLRQRYRDC